MERSLSCDPNVNTSHPIGEELFAAISRPQELVFFDEKHGQERLEKVHEHLDECDLCVRKVQNEIKFY